VARAKLPMADTNGMSSGREMAKGSKAGTRAWIDARVHPTVAPHARASASARDPWLRNRDTTVKVTKKICSGR
jgi:hypothetical protein